MKPPITSRPTAEPPPLMIGDAGVLCNRSVRVVPRRYFLDFLKAKGSLTVDRTLRANVRAQPPARVKHILCRYGYPPDKQEKATQTVLAPAALLSATWATT
ncbi:MAG: type I restriction enzyme endonuclease domain-containing protein [Acidiferrobacteraceae bacterium]